MSGQENYLGNLPIIVYIMVEPSGIEPDPRESKVRWSHPDRPHLRLRQAYVACLSLFLYLYTPEGSISLLRMGNGGGRIRLRSNNIILLDKNLADMLPCIRSLHDVSGVIDY